MCACVRACMCVCVCVHVYSIILVGNVISDEARHPIAVQEFESHVKTRHKNSDNLFADEYEVS